jgi:hypothetical protein
MRKIHNKISLSIFIFVSLLSYFLKASITDVSAQLLVNFFSVVFGFYITSIAILYNSSYIKNLHATINQENNKRGTHELRDYLLVFGYWSIISTTTIIIFSIISTKDTSGVMTSNYFELVSRDFFNEFVNINKIFTSVIIGISSINIFYMVLLMHTIVNGMMSEARSKH